MTMLKMRNFVLLAVSVIALLPLTVVGQASDGNRPPVATAIRSSPAYAEVLLRRTELAADLEALAADYTESNPRIIDLRVELASIDRSLERIYSVKAADAAKLTLALGKLMVRKAALESDLSRQTRSHNKDHPETRRAKKRVEFYEVAIDDILR